MRKILTARDQFDMLSPWRTAGEYPGNHDKTVWTPEQEGMAAELGERLQQKGVSGLNADTVTLALQELIRMRKEKEEHGENDYDYDKSYNDLEAGHGHYDEKMARRIAARALTADSTALMERPVEQKIPTPAPAPAPGPAPKPEVVPAQSTFQPKSTFNQPPLVGARGPNAASKDPVNDPMGKLNNQHYGYEDMVNNIVSHFNGASEEQHRRGRFWYRDARNMFSEIAKKTGISLDRAVAIGAAFSPLTDWDINLEHAQDFIEKYNRDSPDFNENDWNIAHLHPKALQAFKDSAGGRNPTDSDEDIEALADMHHGLFKSGPTLDGGNNLNDPKARDKWTSNIKHHGMEKILRDHEKQVFQNKGKRDTKTQELIGYSPVSAMRDYGIPTLGGNITRAKMISRAEESPELFHALLKGPKVGNFSQNIMDNSEMDDEGYFIHPNGDWTQHADLEGTIDAHHMRASTMADGQWERKGYHSSKDGLNPNNQFIYDVFNTGLQDATKRINSAIQDPRKHLTPKQVQAIVWIKHKEDNDRFRRVPIMHEDELAESEGLPLYQKVRGETLMRGNPVNPFSEKPEGMTKKKYEEMTRIPRGVKNRLVPRSGSRFWQAADRDDDDGPEMASPEASRWFTRPTNQFAEDQFWHLTGDSAWNEDRKYKDKGRTYVDGKGEEHKVYSPHEINPITHSPMTGEEFKFPYEHQKEKGWVKTRPNEERGVPSWEEYDPEREQYGYENKQYSELPPYGSMPDFANALPLPNAMRGEKNIWGVSNGFPKHHEFAPIYRGTYINVDDFLGGMPSRRPDMGGNDVSLQKDGPEAEQLSLDFPTKRDNSYRSSDSVWDHPDLGDMLLDHISDTRGGGTGRHWTTDKDIATQLVPPVPDHLRDKQNFVPVVIKSLWGGRGENSDMPNMGYNLDEEGNKEPWLEDEVNLIPGAQHYPQEVWAIPPGEKEWRNVLSRPHQQREARKMDRFWNKTAEYNNNRVDRDRVAVEGECPGSGVRTTWLRGVNLPACSECGSSEMETDHALRAESHSPGERAASDKDFIWDGGK